MFYVTTARCFIIISRNQKDCLGATWELLVFVAAVAAAAEAFVAVAVVVAVGIASVGSVAAAAAAAACPVLAVPFAVAGIASAAAAAAFLAAAYVAVAASSFGLVAGAASSFAAEEAVVVAVVPQGWVAVEDHHRAYQIHHARLLHCLAFHRLAFGPVAASCHLASSYWVGLAVAEAALPSLAESDRLEAPSSSFPCCWELVAADLGGELAAVVASR